MSLAADLRCMFADFGIDAEVGGIAVRGLFDNGYAEALGGVIAGSRPLLRCAQGDIPAVAIGAAVAIGSASYTVAEIQDDGAGLRLLELEAA